MSSRLVCLDSVDRYCFGREPEKGFVCECRAFLQNPFDWATWRTLTPQEQRKIIDLAREGAYDD